MYGIFRAITGCFGAEFVHDATLKALAFTPGFCFKTPEKVPVAGLGLKLKHPIGLAAGLDKNGRYLKALAKLGFSSIELGTVTPRAQTGNPKPRVFRVPEREALINRMGFNNEGVDALVERVKKTPFDGVLGISIGPNKTTDISRVWLDYDYCLSRVYEHADYIAVNISSPNTPRLRTLQQMDSFTSLITKLGDARHALSDKHGKLVPIVMKVSPDEKDEDLKRMAENLMSTGLEGMILTNTTISRADLQGTKYEKELGGMSGRPLAKRAMQCLKLVKTVGGDDLTLIASGGVDSPEEARARMKAGASWVQVYSGLVYKGPRLISQMVKACSDLSD